MNQNDTCGLNDLEKQEAVNNNDIKRNKITKGEANKQPKCATKMPSSRHKVDDSRDAEFEILKSEVSKWLIQHPDIMQYVFAWIKKSGFIVCDPDDNTWTGINYKEEDM